MRPISVRVACRGLPAMVQRAAAAPSPRLAGTVVGCSRAAAAAPSPSMALLPSRVAGALRGFAASAGTAAEPDSSRSLLGLLLLGTPAVVTFGLGTWQMQRYQWKNELIEFRQGQLNEDPISMAQLASQPDLDQLEYRRVQCTGKLDMKNARFVGPRVKSVCGVTKQGYLMIVPLYPNNGSPPVLVNRGWVPAEWRDAYIAGKPVEKGAARMSQAGILRGSETASAFVPNNTGDQWFWVDVPHLATSCGLPADTPLLDVLLPLGGTPDLRFPPVARPVEGIVTFSVAPSGHLTYAATWYCLCAAVSFLCFRFFRQRPKTRQQPAAPYG